MANPTNQDDSKNLVDTDGHVRVAQVQDTNGNCVVTTRQANVADAVATHTLAATYNATAANAALDALSVKVNALLDILEAHGLMADA